MLPRKSSVNSEKGLQQKLWAKPSLFRGSATNPMVCPPSCRRRTEATSLRLKVLAGPELSSNRDDKAVGRRKLAAAGGVPPFGSSALAGGPGERRIARRFRGPRRFEPDHIPNDPEESQNLADDPARGGSGHSAHAGRAVSYRRHSRLGPCSKISRHAWRHIGGSAGESVCRVPSFMSARYTGSPTMGCRRSQRCTRI